MMSSDEEQKLISDYKQEVQTAFADLDTNGDGLLSKDEYYAQASSTMGDELSEEAQADEDAEDPDDMGRDDAVDDDSSAPAPAASLLSVSRRIKAHKPRAQKPADAAAAAPTAPVPAPELVTLWKDAVTCMGRSKAQA